MKKAIRLTCIDEFIISMPFGYNTKIGGAISNLSGGQMQRIPIARAIYKDPEFIFDEATSSLDATNETKILTNLNLFFVGKTVVIITHRLSTVENTY